MRHPFAFGRALECSKCCVAAEKLLQNFNLPLMDAWRKNEFEVFKGKKKVHFSFRINK